MRLLLGSLLKKQILIDVARKLIFNAEIRLVLFGEGVDDMKIFFYLVPERKAEITIFPVD